MLQNLFNASALAIRHPISRAAPVSTVARILRWQLESRLRSGEIDRPWVSGARLVLQRGMTGATGNIYYGLHEFPEMCLLLHYLRQDDLFIDIGANVGTYTILAARCGGANVVAFEPHPRTALSLQVNVARNDIDELVDVRTTALSDRRGTGFFTGCLDTMNHLVVESENDSLNVCLDTLDQAINGASPTMIKVDVEGHEERVLAGARATLLNPELNLLIVETITADAAKNLASNGFVEKHYDPWNREFRDSPRLKSTNKIFVRDLPRAMERVRSAAKYDIYGISI